MVMFGRRATLPIDILMLRYEVSVSETPIDDSGFFQDRDLLPPPPPPWIGSS